MTDKNMRNQHILEQLKNRITAAGLLISRESMSKEIFYLGVTLNDARRTVMSVSFTTYYRMICLSIIYQSPSIKNELVLLKLINTLNTALNTCSYRKRMTMSEVVFSSSIFVAGEFLDEPSFDLTLREFVHAGHPLSPLLYKRIKKSDNIGEIFGSFLNEIDRPFWHDLYKTYRTGK